MGQETEIFSGRDLKELILPLFLEQLLVMLVGMADTLVVSYAGEAAVSGVSYDGHFRCLYSRRTAVFIVGAWHCF